MLFPSKVSETTLFGETIKLGNTEFLLPCDFFLFQSFYLDKRFLNKTNYTNSRWPQYESLDKFLRKDLQRRRPFGVFIIQQILLSTVVGRKVKKSFYDTHVI